MKFLDKILGINNKETLGDINQQAIEASNQIVVDEEIDVIINILGHLGLLNKKDIEKIVKSKQKNYDQSILTRMMIEINPEYIDKLTKYFTTVELGYGSEKLLELKKQLYSIAEEKKKEGRNKAEIVEELIQTSKNSVESYKEVLRSFNSVIQNLEENITEQAELVAMMDYWTNYFKTQELGHTINIRNTHYVSNDKKSEQQNEEPAVIDHSLSLIELNVERLTTLKRGGYGPEAIATYRNKCSKIMAGNEPENTKYIKINQLADGLIILYNSNLKVFTEWEQSQLEKVPSEQQEAAKQRLDQQVKYMLSLSQDALMNYFVEDSVKKRAETDAHNYKLIFRHLAQKEAAESDNVTIYSKRMSELEQGINPYTEAEMHEAIIDLLISQMEDDKNDSEKYITPVEYIDSTLFQQMAAIETATAAKKKI